MQELKRLAVISCQVYSRELSAALAESSCPCTVVWLPQGLHNTPQQLRERLQEEIDRLEERQARDGCFDAIVLGYSLCGGGVCGVTARTLPLVIPRCDDCIGVLLGSQKRYREYFDSREGIYWYSPGWVDFVEVPCKGYYDKLFEHYCELYGEDNAGYLIECENSWMSRYQNALFICPEIPGHWGRYRDFTRRAAEHFNWRYEELQGSGRMLRTMLSGEWPKDEFLVCPPGRKIGLRPGTAELTHLAADEAEGELPAMALNNMGT